MESGIGGSASLTSPTSEDAAVAAASQASDSSTPPTPFGATSKVVRPGDSSPTKEIAPGELVRGPGPG